MCAGQRERSGRVIEGGSCPRGCCVAGLARGREPSGHMVRVRCLVEVGLMTTNAVRGGALVISSGVTLYAGKRSVRAVQSKSGDRSMVELSPGPCNRCVTLRTRSWKSARDVIGILRGVEIFLVTSDARARRPLKFSSDVTRGTVQIRVRAGQLEASHFEVVELGTLPCIQRCVALLTCGREPHRPMIR